MMHRHFIPILCAALSLATQTRAASFNIQAPTPASSHSTESSTNSTFNAGLSSDRQFNLSLELNANSSNCVEIAFGTDLDNDGVLSRAEADLLLGWDAGAWIMHDRRAKIIKRCTRQDGRKRLDWQLSLKPDKSAKSLNCTDDDGNVFGGTIPPTSFNHHWNLLRVTTRGLSDPEGIILTKVFGWGLGFVIK